MNFRLAFTTHEAAKYSVENWHYSKCLPCGALVKIGVWEDNKFIGCIIYSMGACPAIAKPFELERNQVCELTRIALSKHQNPVSKFLAFSLKMIKKMMPSLKMIVSFADPEQDHHGGIYQATNWIYLGTTKPHEYFVTPSGISIHSKTIRTGRRGRATKLMKEGKIIQKFNFKHKYIYPLDSELNKMWKAKGKKYPKRASNNGNSSGDQPEDGVQVHSHALLINEANYAAT